MRPDYRFASPLHERPLYKAGYSYHRRFRLADILWFCRCAGAAFMMRYANRALFMLPIPRWRCPALIKDYWRRLAASVAVISAIRRGAPQKRRDTRSMAAVDIAIAEEEKTNSLFSVMRRRVSVPFA